MKGYTSDGARRRILPVDAEDDVSQALENVDATTAWETFVRVGRGLERRFTRAAAASLSYRTCGNKIAAKKPPSGRSHA
jgi:hypothetical protein